MNALVFVVSAFLSISAVCGHYHYGNYEGHSGGAGPHTGPYEVHGPSYGSSQLDGPHYGPSKLNGPTNGYASVSGPRVAEANIAGPVNHGAVLSAPVFGGVRYVGGFGGGNRGAWEGHDHSHYY